MKHLVGTLVRYKNGGEFQPYLSSKWNVEDGGRIWKFQIHDGLICENGESISATSYKKSFEKIIPTYRAKSSLPYLDQLIGVGKSLSPGDPISGITSENNTLIFSFSSPVLSGFLDYLSMPYYGYFCDENFKDGIWKSAKSIVSSGPFKLSIYGSESKTSVLNIRTDWHLTQGLPEAPQAVAIHWGSEDRAVELEHSIAQSIDGHFPGTESFQKVLGAPDILFSVILDINQVSPFRDLALRKKFLSVFRNIQTSMPAFVGKNSTTTNTVFIDQKLIAENVGNSEEVKFEGEEIEVLSIKSESEEVRYIEDIVSKALTQMKIHFKFRRIGEDPEIKNIDKASRTKFSVRIASVFSGATYDSWVTDMMFCSDMGISFPDPSKRVCEVVKSALSGKNKLNRKDIGNRVAEIVNEDAAVIPVLHIRNAFYFSPDLNVDQVAPDTIVLSFEDLRPK